ncbi:hypothetical protein [Enterococcus hirae]|uniref:hypothetical protein n=1 Tax=Enterococcus hirae TaxID=1354 RepID=UPI001A972F09|nr:hypothetical protein [Enterococcus hirae]MBO1102874.1 hypothetical protein [Enterococcus hirae]
MVKTNQSQLKAVANYQKFLYGWTRSESEEADEIRERRRGQVYRSNGKTWAKKYASQEELKRYIDELKQIEKERFKTVN